MKRVRLVAICLVFLLGTFTSGVLAATNATSSGNGSYSASSFANVVMSGSLSILDYNGVLSGVTVDSYTPTGGLNDTTIQSMLSTFNTTPWGTLTIGATWKQPTAQKVTLAAIWSNGVSSSEAALAAVKVTAVNGLSGLTAGSSLPASATLFQGDKKGSISGSFTLGWMPISTLSDWETHMATFPINGGSSTAHTLTLNVYVQDMI